jgi:hypothetical protein
MKMLSTSGVTAFLALTVVAGSSAQVTATAIEYRVNAEVVRQGAPYLDVKVTAVNPTSKAVEIAIPDCAVNVRLYDRKGGDRRLVWSSFRLNSSGPPRGARRTCNSGVVEMSLRPRDSITGGPLRYQLSLFYIVSDTVPAGEYAAEVMIDIPGKQSTLDAGVLSINKVPSGSPRDRRPFIPSTLDSSLRHVEFTAKSGIEGTAPSSFAAHVTAHNRGQTAAYFEFGSCALTIFGYRSPQRTGIPAWSSDRSGPPWKEVGDVGRVCLLYLATLYLLPGETASPREFNRAIATYEILGDSLPDGVYHFRAELTVNRQVFSVDAGSARITRRQDPVPSSRTFHGISYSASARRIKQQSASDSLEFTVVIQNQGSTQKTIDGRGCVPVAGFTSAELRDSWYMRQAWTYDWHARPCPLHLPEVTIRPGEVRTLRGRTAAPQSPIHYAFWLNVIVTGEGDQREGEDFALSADEH